MLCRGVLCCAVVSILCCVVGCDMLFVFGLCLLLIVVVFVGVVCGVFSVVFGCVVCGVDVLAMLRCCVCC